MLFEFFQRLSQLVVELSAKYGLIGFFIAAIIANATIFLPLPIEILVFAAGTAHLFNPFILGAVAGSGAAIGEISGYLIGRAGHEGLKKVSEKDLQKILSFKKKLEKHGTKIIFLFALIPIAFDIVGIASGLTKFDFKKFFTACWAGKVIRYIIVASAGYYGIEIIKALIV